MDPFEPRTTVDVLAIVGHPVERDELPSGLRRHADEEIVEDLAPRPGVQGGAVGQHALDVEETGPGSVRAVRASRCVTGTGESHGSGRTPAASASRMQLPCRLVSLAYELVLPLLEVRRGQGDVGGTQRTLRRVECPLPTRADRLQLERLPWSRRSRRHPVAGNHVVRDAPCSRFRAIARRRVGADTVISGQAPACITPAPGRVPARAARARRAGSSSPTRCRTTRRPSAASRRRPS